MIEDSEDPNFYPMFLSMMTSIRHLSEGGRTWDEIETKVVGDLIESQGKQYMIYNGQKCGHPSICNKTAVIMFIYPHGPIGGCIEHALPTVNEFIEMVKKHDDTYNIT